MKKLIKKALAHGVLVRKCGAKDDVLIQAPECFPVQDKGAIWIDHSTGLSWYLVSIAALKEALKAEPTVEESIVQLVEALKKSKGWPTDYANAIVRDAIDRTVPLTLPQPIQDCNIADPQAYNYAAGWNDYRKEMVKYL